MRRLKNPDRLKFPTVRQISTFDLGDVRVVLALAAHVLHSRGDILEALVAVLRVPLRRRPVVGLAELLSGAAASPLRQALLRGETRERRDRAGLAAVAMHAVAVALISRILQGVLLARRPARLRQRARGYPLLNDGVAVRIDLPHAPPHGDLLELDDFGAVKLALLHESLEALLERGIARPGGRPPVRRRVDGRSARFRVL